MKFIVYAIPAFFIFIAVEFIIDKLRKTNMYRVDDTVTNLSLGMGSQITGLFIKLFTVLAYAYVYDHWRVMTIPVTWWSILLLFLLFDLAYYWFHRLAHEVSILWGKHIVHHQSEEYNFMVALRQSWTQGLFSWFVYIPIAFLGFDTYSFVLIGAIDLLYQFWIHTKLIKKLPAPIEFIFNTPSHHRVHHGINPQYIDKNHGGTLIIWDRIFGTFAEEKEEVVYGITTPVKTWEPVKLNFMYFVQLTKLFFAAKGFSNKMKVLFKGPGWKPKELGGQEIPQPVSVQSFQKFTTHIPNAYTIYIFIQFLGVLIFTSMFLNLVETPDFSSDLLFKGLISAGIIWSILSIGKLLEVSAGYNVVEAFRLIFQTAVWTYLGVSAFPQYQIECFLFSVFFHAISGFWYLSLPKLSKAS